MREQPGATRRALGIGLAWTALWLAFWAMVAGIIGIVSAVWLTIARRWWRGRPGVPAAV